MKWKPISTVPKKGQILVTGGTLFSELDRDEGMDYDVAIVHAEEQPWSKEEIERKTKDYLFVDFCYYGLWVREPTHWMLLPELPKEIKNEMESD